MRLGRVLRTQLGHWTNHSALNYRQGAHTEVCYDAVHDVVGWVWGEAVGDGREIQWS